MVTGPALTVPCPTCGRQSPYSAGNPWRPFCSEPCRNHDLGAWASERFRIAAAQPADDGDVDEHPAPQPRS